MCVCACSACTCMFVMEVIRHAELIVQNGSFGRSSTPTVHLIIQSNVLLIMGFVRHTVYA